MFLQYQHIPVCFSYPAVSQECLQNLQAEAEPVSLIEYPDLKLENVYHEMGLAGTRRQMFVRRSVSSRLQKFREEITGTGYSIFLYDAFRSRLTQIAIFEQMRKKISGLNPDWSDQQIEAETLKYAAHPEKSTRYPISPHNSGGAIDLTLARDGKAVDMGTDFDDPRELSAVIFFEEKFCPKYNISEQRWLDIRKNRRLLFHSLTQLGFTSNRREWWHYDLGDCLWAQEHSIDWYYPAMEDELQPL